MIAEIYGKPSSKVLAVDKPQKLMQISPLKPPIVVCLFIYSRSVYVSPE